MSDPCNTWSTFTASARDRSARTNTKKNRATATTASQQHQQVRRFWITICSTGKGTNRDKC